MRKLFLKDQLRCGQFTPAECGQINWRIYIYVKMVEGGTKGQLYNLEADPLETTNLYLKESKTITKLSDLLDKIVNQGYSRRMK